MLTEYEQLVAFIPQGREIRKSVEQLMDGIDEQTEEFLAGDRTIQHVTSYIDRWQHDRSKLLRWKWKATRNLVDAQFAFDEEMRVQLATQKGLKPAQKSWHYEERTEIYKTNCVDHYRLVRLFQLVDADVQAALKQYDTKIWWLEDMRRQMRRDDDDFRFSSSRDHIGS